MSREMKDSGIEWIGSLPSTWKICKVKNCFVRKNDKAMQEDPVILSLARSGVKIRDISKNEGQIAESYYNYNPVEPGDLLLMLLSIPPKYSVSQVMGYLKGKSSLMIFDRHANLKYKYGNRHFWARGYYVDTVGRNKKQIQEYIRNQLQEDQIADQISIKEFVDPFTGSVNKKA